MAELAGGRSRWSWRCLLVLLAVSCLEAPAHAAGSCPRGLAEGVVVQATDSELTAVVATSRRYDLKSSDRKPPAPGLRCVAFAGDTDQVTEVAEPTRGTCPARFSLVTVADPHACEPPAEGHLCIREEQERTYAVKAPELGQRVSRFVRGDRLCLTEKDGGIQGTADVAARVVAPSRMPFLIALLIPLILVPGPVWWLRPVPRGLIIGKDGRYSNSKIQAGLWFWMFIAAYVASGLLRWWYGDVIGGIAVPGSLLAVVGLSAGTMVAAKGITVSKVEAGESEAKARGAARAATDVVGAAGAAAAVQASKAGVDPAVPAAVDAVVQAARDASASLPSAAQLGGPDAVERAARGVADAAAAAAQKGTGVWPAAALPAAQAVAQAAQAAVQAATASGKGAAQDGVKSDKKGGAALFQDLFRDDNGRLDLGDVQMLVGTVLALGVFALQVLAFLARLPLAASTLPDVDSTLLATFGLGQAAYLTKKYVGGPEK